jgi:hypothetical protein
LAKTPEQVLKETALAIDRGFDRFRQDKTLSDFAQKEIAPNIVKRSRLGFGVRLESKQQYKFPPLANSYIEQRKGLIRFITLKNGAVFPIKQFQELTRARIRSMGTKRARKNKSLLKRLKAFFGKKKEGAVKSKIKKVKPKLNAGNLSANTSPAKSNITATGLLLDRAIGATARAKQIIIFIKNIKYQKDILGFRIKNPPTTVDVAGYLQDNLDREFLQTSEAEDNRLSRVMSKIIIKDIETELSKIK